MSEKLSEELLRFFKDKIFIKEEELIHEPEEEEVIPVIEEEVIEEPIEREPEPPEVEEVKEEACEVEGTIVRKATAEQKKAFVDDIKKVNTRNYHSDRLHETEIHHMLLEIFKNAFEYGTNFFIDIEDDKIKFRNGVPKRHLRDLTFPSLMRQLTSLEDVTTENFNEGLTTLLGTRFLLRVREYAILSEYTGEGFFMTFSGENSSHGIKEEVREGVRQEVVYLFNDFPHVDHWEITIFTKETEEILSKEVSREIEILEEDLARIEEGKDSRLPKTRRADTPEEIAKERRDAIASRKKVLERMENLHERMIKEIKTLYDKFYLPKSFLVTINGTQTRPTHEQDPKDMPTYHMIRHKGEQRTHKGRFIYYIEMPDERDERFYVIWKLAKDGFYHIVRNNAYDNKGVWGFLITTTIDQFGRGKKREQLEYWFSDKIAGYIDVYVKEHEKEVELSKQLKKYSEYRANLTNYLMEILGVTKRAVDSVFFESQRTLKEKEENLINISNYIHTIRTLFPDPIEKLEDKKGVKLGLKERGTLAHPEGHSAKVMGEKKGLRREREIKEFQEMTSKLEYNPFIVLGSEVVGYDIGWGSSERLALRRLLGKTELLTVNIEEYPRKEAVEAWENMTNVFYPKKNAFYFAGMGGSYHFRYVRKEEVSERKAIKIKDIKILEKHNLVEKEKIKYEEEERKKKEEELKKKEEELKKKEEDLEDEEDDEEKEKKRKELEEKRKELEEKSKDFRGEYIKNLEEWREETETRLESFKNEEIEYEKAFDEILGEAEAIMKFEPTKGQEIIDYINEAKKHLLGAFPIESFHELRTDIEFLRLETFDEKLAELKELFEAGLAWDALDEARADVEDARDDVDDTFLKISKIRFSVSSAYLKALTIIERLRATDDIDERDVTVYSEETGKQHFLGEIKVRDDEGQIVEIIPYMFNTEDDWEKWRGGILLDEDLIKDKDSKEIEEIYIELLKKRMDSGIYDGFPKFRIKNIFLERLKEIKKMVNEWIELGYISGYDPNLHDVLSEKREQESRYRKLEDHLKKGEDRGIVFVRDIEQYIPYDVHEEAHEYLKNNDMLELWAEKEDLRSLGFLSKLGRYLACKRAVQLIGEMERISPLYLAWWNDPDAKVGAFYMRANRLVVINANYLKKSFSKKYEGRGMTKQGMIHFILDLVIHEITHEWVSGHNQRFILQKESMMTRALVRRLYLEFHDIDL